MLPKPTRGCAIIWERSTTAIAIIPSNMMVLITALSIFMVPLYTLFYGSLWLFLWLIHDGWVWVAGLLCLLNVLLSETVYISKDGIMLRRFHFCATKQQLSADGMFVNTSETYDLFSGHKEYSRLEQLVENTIGYCYLDFKNDTAVCIPCFRPDVLCGWLNAQIIRVNSQRVSAVRTAA